MDTVIDWTAELDTMLQKAVQTMHRVGLDRAGGSHAHPARVYYRPATPDTFGELKVNRGDPGEGWKLASPAELDPTRSVYWNTNVVRHHVHARTLLPFGRGGVDLTLPSGEEVSLPDFGDPIQPEDALRLLAYEDPEEYEALSDRLGMSWDKEWGCLRGAGWGGLRMGDTVRCLGELGTWEILRVYHEANLAKIRPTTWRKGPGIYRHIVSLSRDH